MFWMRIFARMALFFAVLLALAVAPARGQDDDDPDGGDEGEEESVIEIGAGPSDADSDYRGIRVEPYPPTVPPNQAEPNRPDPVIVGRWEPPALKKGDREILDSLLARRAANPQEVDARYTLANFYLRVAWLPQAEAEFLECAKLEKDSIRPWEGLLRVYGAELPGEPELPEGLVLPANLPAAQRNMILRQLGVQNKPDWIPSAHERSQRVARALLEIVRLRPDDIGRRRALLDHYRGEGRYELAEEQARAILELVPGDVPTRYELGQAMLFQSQEPDQLAKVRVLLEENVRRAPDHAPSLLRLARVLAVLDGVEAADRIRELQQRAFLRLFVVPALGTVPFREDTFRMAQSLAGKSVASQLWAGAMEPEGFDRWSDGEARHIVRWIEPFKFPNSQGGERDSVIATLARRGDAAAAVIILSYLWHADDPAAYLAEDAPLRASLEKSETNALESVAGLGEVAFPAAEKFLRAADTPARRRRGVTALRLIGDKRGVAILIDQLEHDQLRDVSFGVAAALESLGDPHAIDALVAAAGDTERPLPRRREAAEALAAFNDPRAIEAINRLASDTGFETVVAYGRFRLTGSEDALARLEKFVEADGGSMEILRLADKCPDPRIRSVFVATLRRSGDPAVREHALRRLRERFWNDSRAEVEAIFLKEAESSACTEFVLEELGEIGGEAATTRILKILEGPVQDDRRWAAACRALARTGDERAVRWFSRRKVLEKDPGKRKLAAELHAEAARRHAELHRPQ